MKKILVHLAIVAIFLGAMTSAFAETVHQPSAVVELYTSQGCSSCPPANAYMGELAMNKDLLALSFNVTYWDYIGWKDTLADKSFDHRQAYYRDHMNAKYVYTPQMVIAGSKHEVGSDRYAVQKVIDNVGAHAKQVKLDWNMKESTLTVNLPKTDTEAVVWLFHMDQKHTVLVKRGENSGKTLNHHNVVRKIEKLGDWKGNSEKIDLDLALIRELGRDSCALVVQQKGYGDIIAALQITL